MIQLTCNNCKAVLTMDDAFAGGACRCQYCGTIQTVPSRLKKTAVVAVEGQPPSGKSSNSRTLYRNRPKTDAGTGLDELAEVVASSGLSSGALGSSGASHLTAKQKAAVARANRLHLLLAGGAAVIVLLAGAVVWLALYRTPPVTVPPLTGLPNDLLVEAATAEPSFLSISLKGQCIVYVVDRGTGTQKAFADIKEAVLRSAQSLGPDRRFQIVFWNNGTDESFPTGSATYATRSNLEAARRTLDNITAFGTTDVSSAMTKAMQAQPQAVILVTGKAWNLENSFAEMVLDFRKDADVRIHTVAVGGAGDSAAFETIADRTGGEFRDITEGELRGFVR